MSRNSGRLAIELRRSRGGLAALAALLLATVIGCVVIANGLQVTFPWDNTYTFQVSVDSAKGVVPGKQQVRIAGFPVGKITNAELIDGRPVLTMSIDGQYGPLYRNAELRLRPKTPLDDLYMDVINRGTPSAGVLRSGEILPAERTIVPVDIGEVLDAFDADTRVRLKQAIDGLGSGLAGSGGQNLRAALLELAPFLNAAQRVTGELALHSTETADLVHNFRVLTEALDTRDTQLHELVVDGASTVTELGSEQQQIAATVSELAPALQQLLPTFATLRATENQLDPALDALEPSAQALPGGLEALRKFSVDAHPALTALRTTLPDLRSLVAALKPTAAGLERDFSALEPQAPRLNSITAAIVPCELAVDKFFNNTISLTKFSDTGGVIVRGQTVDGIDPNQRAAASCAPGGP